MTSVPADAPALEMRGITKRFGATSALEGVDLVLRKGDVHALLGENGAGKSTLVKILSGALRPDRGEMRLAGRPYHPADPLHGRRSGVSMIYQELNLAPHLTVEENIMLGTEVHSGGFLKRRDVRKKIKDTLTFLHHPEIGLDVPVRQLSVGSRQIVEISRAIMDKARILVMDEPTSSLAREDTERLFEVIRKLKAEGVSIIYISHFLEEVREVADAYTVLRDGQNVGAGRMAEATLDAIIQLMVGQKIADLFPRVKGRAFGSPLIRDINTRLSTAEADPRGEPGAPAAVDHERGEVALSLNGLKGVRMAEAVSLDLHRGEILGLAGLVGAGRTETLRAVFGLDPRQSGWVEIGGVKALKLKPWQMIQRGFGLLSEDRQGEGLALARSLTDNITLSRFGPYRRWGFLSLKKRSRAALQWMGELKIKAQGSGQAVAGLSGGNQQKVALARLLHQDADVLLLDEPTRGIDVLSKAQIYDWMSRLAARGKGILFVSSYFPELLGVCDRIAVFFRGQVVDVRPAAGWSDESLMAAATTGKG
ncbi:MAG: sugar ABC transporter ATP-binding protein [Candidatus Aminicenantes bacterium]|nr:sugar ABC transporter ATP-binding protein [Candidatus Aminicenantes bacterium]